MTADNWIAIASLVEVVTIAIIGYLNNRITKLETDLAAAKEDVIRLEVKQTATHELGLELKQDMKELKEYIQKREHDQRSLLSGIESTLKILIQK